MDASDQLSYLTPINVLLANPTLDSDDAVLFNQLLSAGADPGYGLLGARGGTDPLAQLHDRDPDGSELAPLLGLLAGADEPLENR